MSLLDYKAVKKQSQEVFKNFEKKWMEHSRINSQLPFDHPHAYWNIGLGKSLVCVAMGASLEKDIEALKQYRDRVDILCCDKAFGKLLDHGIKADYVMLADANISFDWIKPYVYQTEGVRLISTVYANPAWTKAWKGQRTFYMNKDAIQSERNFLPMWGDNMRVIPASSNVSNAMLVFMLGCDDNLRINFAGYQNYFLTGFDYSWRSDGNYYAFNNPIPKRHYMNHRTFLDYNKDICHTSENLIFSAKWLMQYIETFKLPVVNCSGRGLLEIREKGNLADILPRLNADKSAPGRVRELFAKVQKLQAEFATAEKEFNSKRGELVWQ
jgi:hypothetical protein